MPIKKDALVSSDIEKKLEKLALSQLKSGSYQEAIISYKKLWLISDNEKTRQQLGSCYLQTASSFAARGMYKEALLLWDKYIQYTDSPYQAYEQYISWLIQTKDRGRIQSCLTQLSAQQLDKQYPQLTVLLGFLMLTEHPEFQQYLPQDSTLLRHFEFVQAALLAYQDNHHDELKKTLQKIPYRSAFRDFRNLLTTALLIPEDIEQARIRLVKIPTHSPYSQAARLLLACTLDGSELAKSLQPFNHSQQRIVAEIKGLNKKQLAFIEQITRHHEGLSDKLKFNLAIQYQSLCGTELAQGFCQAQLASYPDGRGDFNKNFIANNVFEENRIKALICEADNNSVDAENYWKLCIKILINEDTDNGLKIALILRHIAGQLENEEQVQYLIESLLHDPEDDETYLKILRYYSLQPDTGKEYKQWLGKTLEKFPQHIDVLTLATQIAIRNKAYKKASDYALKILKVDSLNVFAKQLLFSSHIAHARRLLQNKKYHLVENEIQQAETFSIGKNNTIQTRLLRGFLCFADLDKQQGIQLIAESLNQLNSDPINIHFQATMEVQLTGLPVATILRELASISDYLLSFHELTRLIQQIQQYAKDHEQHEQIHKALDRIKLALKKSLLQGNVDENQLLILCQTWININHFELLRYCVKLALAKWENPIWKFYQLYVEVNGLAERCTQKQIIHLETMREHAMKDKHHRAVVLIDEFVEAYYRVHPERKGKFINDLFSISVKEEKLEVEAGNPLEILFAHVPEKVLLILDEKLEALSKITTPELLLEQLKNDIDDDKKIMSLMLQKPDLFTALLMIRAADELGINIDVSVAEVIECFSLQ